MRRLGPLLGGLLLLAGSGSMAQEGDEPAPAPAAQAVEAEAPTPPSPEPPPRNTSGDIIYIKGGSSLSGQVVDRDPLTVYLEVAPGVRLSVPRKQIETIEYDDITPARLRLAQQRKTEKEKRDLI
ncbi:MAG TPA: hypothetical protein ENN80_13520, partial [Candidatus Hydrogenedentes bacterium]|nr:hypothetical protein [Candidatus Hydrogenedentota bacterium]